MERSKGQCDNVDGVVKLIVIQINTVLRFVHIDRLRYLHKHGFLACHTIEGHVWLENATRWPETLVDGDEVACAGHRMVKEFPFPKDFLHVSTLFEIKSPGAVPPDSLDASDGPSEFLKGEDEAPSHVEEYEYHDLRWEGVKRNQDEVYSFRFTLQPSWLFMETSLEKNRERKRRRKVHIHSINLRNEQT